ncbi:hypothetical protein C8R43DRAFT_947407 [Mycena crocata]|nr:hypothetical protein C8R43DRAFT_947407 [Mycena crocata]
MSSSSAESAGSGRSFFEHPRPAPSLPTSSCRSARSTTPEGFVLPIIPPVDDPLVVTYDAHGHRQLPRVSDTPLAVDDSRVMQLIEYNPAPYPKCSNCAEMAIACSFVESGLPCPSCVLLGVPDCDWADPFRLVDTLRNRRDSHLMEERDALVKAVRNNQLSPSLFEREFERVQAWFYSAAQGALTRFMVNSRATRDIASRGFYALAAASSDPALLLRFLTLGAETRIHPSILQIVSERVQYIFQSMMS